MADTDTPKKAIDWTSVRRDYEQGLSLRTLETKYGPSKSAIQKKAKDGHWVPGQKMRQGDVQVRIPIPLHPEHEDVLDMPLPEFVQLLTDEQMKDVVAVSLQLLMRIAGKVDTKELEVKDIKLLADALSQCHKILATRVADQEHTAYDLRDLLAKCTNDELAIVKPVFAAVSARDKEQQSNQSDITNVVSFQKRQ